ncbi:prosaposin [Prorops nasuta]|uniref:prosaposin n=1 Tax=Prorops nasuta TaxID=863751 RepID=UPI0034CD2D4E
MKQILLALSAILAVAAAGVVISAEWQETPHLLGTKACTWGPSYWCQNLTTSAGCGATKHCIKHDWEYKQVPEDNDSVCGICKDMVKQARDQLESNQTQQDLKDVFEGSCMLIHIKPIVKECISLVDQFIPDLVETLASQMNPSVVCSVAGLCNSPRIDQLLLDYEKTSLKGNSDKVVSLVNDEMEPDECSKCHTVASYMAQKLRNTPKDKLLNNMLNVCGRISSFSDACAAIVVNYFDSFYTNLQDNFNAENVCHLSGQCVAKYHKHDETDKTLKVEIRPMSSVGLVDIGDDLPCKLCEQLVSHLRDLLVANTTEIEFMHVLEGVCKQTKSFASECKAIVDQYYPQIYAYLTKGLNANAICEMTDICPAPQRISQSGPIWPLLPEKTAQLGIRILNEEKSEKSHKNLEAEEMQLPIERMSPPLILMAPEMDVKGKETCAFCEYLLHYIQQAISSPATEQEVKTVLGKVCKKLPDSVEGTCENFVDTYGDAIVAILVQEIDPSQVCPMMHVCPSQEFIDMWEHLPKEMMLRVELKDKPSCPLCLLAVTQIYNIIKNDKSEANIERALDKLCNHLPHNLAGECTDLVKGYSKELVEMLLADLSPQEVCSYLKLCDASKNVGPPSTPINFYPIDKDGEIMTNEIPNFPLHPIIEKKPVNAIEGGNCMICEIAMHYIEKVLKTPASKSEIENLVHGICNHLPRKYSAECNAFVTEYADIVIDLLAKDVTAKELCSMINLCKVSMKHLEESVSECALCQSIISSTDTHLGKSYDEEDLKNTVQRVCKYLPATQDKKCTAMINVYGPSIQNLYRSRTNSGMMCKKMSLCGEVDFLMMSQPRFRRQLGTEKCTWGPSYWCASDSNANECNALQHCRENVWHAQRKP